MSINKQNLDAVFGIIVDFEEVGKVLRRLLNSRLSLDFQRYRSILLDLEKRFEIMQSNFRSKIQTLLPKLRKNEASPVELTELILEYNTSPYEKETFLALLNTRQKEIETAEYIIYNNNFGSTTVMLTFCSTSPIWCKVLE